MFHHLRPLDSEYVAGICLPHTPEAPLICDLRGSPRMRLKETQRMCLLHRQNIVCSTRVWNIALDHRHNRQHLLHACGQHRPDRIRAISQRGCDWCLSEIDDAQACRNACPGVGHQDPLRKIRRVCQPQYGNGVCGRYCVQNSMHDKCLVRVAHDFCHAVVKEANVDILYDTGTGNVQPEIRRKH